VVSKAQWDMRDLRGRRILIGVSGSIAAFKAATLAGMLTRAGASVRVMMTASGERFVSAETFRDLTGNSVATSLWVATSSGELDHIDLAQWAELVAIVPASANVVARAALGLADDIVTTVLLATTAPVLMAPAMETQMWEHQATQDHTRVLQDRGVRVVGPVHGRLASGMSGAGRMAEPEEIMSEIGQLLHVESGAAHDFAGVRVVVTAGPTREPIDPVRYISNRSSGKMGYEIARAAFERGASVTLISGPVDQTLVESLPATLSRVEVETAAEMKEAVIAAAKQAQVVIMAAAVADFRPAETRTQKWKKADRPAWVALEATEDILADLRDLAPKTVRVGFAAETDNLVANAAAKLDQKGLAMVIANDVSEAAGGVFGSDTNQVTILQPGRPPEELPRSPKREVARRILDQVLVLLKTREGQP
jgi:phosphopantothenoylcysteine decarboxylase / phosphopantothenate---cysteine ligase